MKTRSTMIWKSPTVTVRIAALLAGLVLATPQAAPAQGRPLALRPSESGERSEGTALAQGRYAVVIDLDQNRLFFKKGEITLWSAPVGTGTGLRLQSSNREWKFSTPNGNFHVQYKEQNPVWIAPDWYFVENGLPVPPQGDSRRYFPGGLGAAAVFIDRELAIHGTNRPELLGQRVSHGCIRLANKDALRLYHNVQVGTEVIIVGGEDLPERVVTPERLMAEKASAGSSASRSRPVPPDPLVEEWKVMPTGDLLEVLDNELSLNERVSRWPEVASLLLDRGLKKGDGAALRGLMAQIGALPSVRLEREYATFLADAYGRGALHTLAALSRLDVDKRAEVARAIVEATMNLYHGDFHAPGAPWPTARIPRSAVGPEGRRGWEVLAEAEQVFRKSDLALQEIE